MILTVILIFIASFLADMIWALYIKHVAEKEALKSALYGTLIYMFGAYTVLEYTKNPWYLIPALIGAFLGTYVTVKYTK